MNNIDTIIKINILKLIHVYSLYIHSIIISSIKCRIQNEVNIQL